MSPEYSRTAKRILRLLDFINANVVGLQPIFQKFVIRVDQILYLIKVLMRLLVLLTMGRHWLLGIVGLKVHVVVSCTVKVKHSSIRIFLR